MGMAACRWSKSAVGAALAVPLRTVAVGLTSDTAACPGLAVHLARDAEALWNMALKTERWVVVASSAAAACFSIKPWNVAAMLELT